MRPSKFSTSLAENVTCSSESTGLGVHVEGLAIPFLGTQKGTYGVVTSWDGLLASQDSCASGTPLSTG